MEGLCVVIGRKKLSQVKSTQLQHSGELSPSNRPIG